MIHFLFGVGTAAALMFIMSINKYVTAAGLPLLLIGSFIYLDILTINIWIIVLSIGFAAIVIDSWPAENDLSYMKLVTYRKIFLFQTIAAFVLAALLFYA